MTLAPGSRLGPYRIDALVGEGGMGEVYRGVDTRLDRIVAIKVLSSHLSSHPQLRERFEREARAISSLSHPNICTLFDVGQHEGVEYLVMEYLEGESLADRLARGPLPIEQVIRYGSQIAEALARAHRQGVVHRDLKPGNVMLSKGNAKLLDFGLAKTASTFSPSSGSEAPTEAWKPLTEEGTMLGTFQYMSPEQLEGREADARSDIFALGVLLYEMATARRAFEGKSRASLIASILDRDPPSLTSLQPAAPAALERLVRACLAKDPDVRLQSAHDASLELAWIGETNGQTGAAGRQRPWRVLAMTAAAALIAGAVMTAILLRGNRRATPTPVSLSLLAPGGGEFGGVAISPTGTIAFAARDRQGKAHLYKRSLGDPTVTRVADIWNEGMHMFWSPDAKWLAYFDRNRLMKMPAAGGQPEKICDTSYGVGGVWDEDGTIIFTPSFFQPLHIVSATGGKSRPFTTLDKRRKEAVHAFPYLLPSGDGILYLAVGAPTESSRIMHVTRDGRKTKEVIEADSLVGYSEPFLLFIRQANIYAIRFDAENVKTTGEPTRVAEQVDYSASQLSARTALGMDGTLMFPSQVREKRRFVWYDRDGRSLGVALEGDDIGAPKLSPDGTKLLFHRRVYERGTLAVYSFDLARGTETRLTSPPAFGWNPVWLPGGERFAFSTARASSVIDLYVQAEDPHATAEPLWVSDSGDDKGTIGFTPDGEYLIAREYTVPRLYDLWLIPLREEGERKLLVGTTASENDADVSPDGRWLAYEAGEFLAGPGVMEIYLRAMTGGRSFRISTAGGHCPRWSRDGSEIFFLGSDRTMMRVAIDHRTNPPKASLPEPLFRIKQEASTRWDLSADGKRFLFDEPADSASAVDSYNVVTGWKEPLLSGSN